MTRFSLWFICFFASSLFASEVVRNFELIWPSLDKEAPTYLKTDLYPILNSYDFDNCDCDDKFILKIYLNSPFHAEKVIEFNLIHKIFEAAVGSANFSRLYQLLLRGKHSCLPVDIKSKILLVAIESLESSKDLSSTYDIIVFLLNNGFYYEDVILTCSSCPFYQVIKDPEASKIFLNFDNEIFKKQTDCNYVKKYIEFCNYSAAEKALDLGCDPSIKINGRNALDAAVIYFHKDQTIDQPRQQLVRKLTEIYNLKISNTLENLLWFCERGQFQNALTVLRSDEIPVDSITDMFGYIFTSPLQVALKYKNIELINESLEMYLDRFSLDQLKRALLFAKTKEIQGELLNVMKRAYIKIQERINNLENDII